MLYLLIFIITLQGGYQYPHFADEDLKLVEVARWWMSVVPGSWTSCLCAKWLFLYGRGSHGRALESNNTIRPEYYRDSDLQSASTESLLCVFQILLPLKCPSQSDATEKRLGLGLRSSINSFMS